MTRVIDANELKRELKEQWVLLRSGEMDRPDIGDETDWAIQIVSEQIPLCCGRCIHWGGRNSYGEVVSGFGDCDMAVSISDLENLPDTFACNLWELA